MEDHWTGGGKNADRIADGKEDCRAASGARRISFWQAMHRIHLASSLIRGFTISAVRIRTYLTRSQHGADEGRGLWCAFLHNPGWERRR